MREVVYSVGKKINVLDCTLREAPVENLTFGGEFIGEFISRLSRSKVDYVEIGFLKDANYEYGSTIFNSACQINEYKKYIGNDVKIVALVDVGRFDLNTLDSKEQTCLDGIRVCFKKGEQDEAITAIEVIKEKGYLAFLQHVDTLGYSEKEIVEIIKKVNRVKPDVYSIVDTFGSMYVKDLRHIFKLVNGNLDSDISLGFHAHNNLQIANANAQEFVELCIEYNRKCVIDSSCLGCGRGAGNTNTEILIEYLNRNHNCNYNTDELLDLIDVNMPNIESRCDWGYSIPHLISGFHSSHVFNVHYLMKRHNINSKDLRKIIELLDDDKRKTYDFDYLEGLYVDYFNNSVDDRRVTEKLRNELKEKDILLVALGNSIRENENLIRKFVLDHNVTIININHVSDIFPPDYVFFSNIRRFHRYKDRISKDVKVIVTSNMIGESLPDNTLIIDYAPLVESGRQNIDNATILILKYLKRFIKNDVYVAGLDGYSENKNYYIDDMENVQISRGDIEVLNTEIQEMLDEVQEGNKFRITFITPTRYK